MSMVNGSDLRAASKAFKAVFYSEFERKQAELQPYIDALATVIKTSDEIVEHRWINDLPKMREWVGDRIAQKLSTSGFTLKMADYEATIEVHRNDLRYDKIGIVKPRIMQLANSAARLPYDQLVALLNGAFTTTLSYDGIALCANSHASGDNLTTDLFDADAYRALRAQMKAAVDANGDKLGISPTHIIYASSIADSVEETFKQERLATGESNIDSLPNRRLQLAEMPELTDGYWFLADLSKMYKPFIWQEYSGDDGVNFTAMDNPTDENAFRRKIFEYGVDRSGKAGAAFHQLIAGSNASGS